MSQLIIWTKITFKRLFNKTGFLSLLIIFPLLSLLVFGIESKESNKVSVGFIMGSDSTAIKASQGLLKENGIFSFIEYKDEEKLIKDVVSKKLETGIIFPNDLTDKIQNDNFKNSIKVIKSPASISHGAIIEIVFSHVIDAYGEKIIKDQVQGESFFSTISEEEINNLILKYHSIKDGDSTYKFKYEFLNGESFDKTKLKVFPIKGIAAIFIMLTAFSTVLSTYKDEQMNIYRAFYSLRRRIALILSVLIPVFIICLEVIFIYLVIYGLKDTLIDIPKIFFYALSISVFITGCRIFFKKASNYAVLLPVILLGSLIASPVIIDLKRIVPSLSLLEKFFFPSYYLSLSERGEVWAMGGLFIMLILGIFLLFIEKERKYTY